MELVNALYQIGRPAAGDRQALSVIRETIDAAVLLLSPIVPHFCEELWTMLGHGQGVADSAWPAFDPAVASEEEITIVVQVNGKVRSRVTVSAGEEEARIKTLARTDGKIAKLITGKELVKEIYVPNKLVNIVVRGNT